MFSHYVRALVVFLAFSTSAYADLTCTPSCEQIYDESHWGLSQVYYSSKNRIACNWGNGSFNECYSTCSGEGCDAGETLATLTGQCVGSPCPDGWTETGGICLPHEQPDPCENIVGYINGVPVCDDLRDECEASGGQLGQMNGESICVPEDESPPLCDGDGVIGLVEGGYVCESPTDNENGTDNQDEGSSGGSDPDTDVGISPIDDPTDVDPETLSDSTQLAQESLKESQEQSKSLRKVENQLGDVNDELDAQSGFMDRAEARENARDEGRAMPAHTVNGSASFAEASSSFYSGLTSLPIITAFGNVADVFPTSGGVCPEIDIDLGDTLVGGTIGTDLHCTLLDDYSGEIAVICWVLFGIVGFRVIGSS